jgi:flagellar hook-associated protein 2
MATGSINFSGLASGLNTSSIIQQLVSIESQPITALGNQQTALKSQVSLLGTLASNLKTLQTAADSLKTTTVPLKVTSTNTSFSATVADGASVGDHTIFVTSPAKAAQARSQAFDAATSLVNQGTFSVKIGSTSYDVAFGPGDTLQDAASAINGSGAPVQARVAYDGSKYYLSVAATNPGIPTGATAQTALTFSFTQFGAQGQALAMTGTQPASNAQLTVDGLPTTGNTNTITDVIPGVTLQLKTASTADETLSVGTDTTQATANVQAFVDAYNTVAKFVESQLHIDSGTNRSSTLAGDTTLRNLQMQLQGLLQRTVPGVTAGLGSLPGLGITTQQDGTISLDSAKLATALQDNPSQVALLFGQADTGISALTDNLVSQFTDSVSGSVTQRTKSINDRVKSIDDQKAQMQVRIDSYQKILTAQFAAMEKIVSQYKSLSSYLNNFSTSSTGSSTSSTTGG